MAPAKVVKNKEELYCTNCPSKILLSEVGLYVKVEKELPKLTQRKDATEIERGLILESYQVKNPFYFENVGFSKKVKDIKYLTCSECELGPLGWQDLRSGLCYIAISRVRQGNVF